LLRFGLLFFFLVSHKNELVNAGLGVGITLHADSLARPLACAGVGAGALATHGQAAQVADATVTLDGLQTFEVQADFAAQIALDDVFAVLDCVDNLRELLLVQVLRTDGVINPGRGEDDRRVGRADAVDVAERDVDALLAGDFNTDDACHSLTLTLFVAPVRANDPNDALAPHDFA